MGFNDATVMLLSCTDQPASGPTGPVPAGLRPVIVPARPGRADIDPLLADGGLRRLVVAGTDADLAAVLVRLLRTNRLDVELAYVPADRRSVAARLWGLPHGPAAFELARHGRARPAPLVRDDAGGVLVGRGELRGAGGGGLHGEVFCDGELVLRGGARRLVATPWPDAPEIPAVETSAAQTPASALARPAPPAVAVRAGHTARLPDGRLHAVPSTARTGRGSGVGRAVQVGCLPATLLHDGVAHPRPVTRWAWYRHVADWLLVRGHTG